MFGVAVVIVVIAVAAIAAAAAAAIVVVAVVVYRGPLAAGDRCSINTANLINVRVGCLSVRPCFECAAG